MTNGQFQNGSQGEKGNCGQFKGSQYKHQAVEPESQILFLVNSNQCNVACQTYCSEYEK